MKYFFSIISLSLLLAASDSSFCAGKKSSFRKKIHKLSGARSREKNRRKANSNPKIRALQLLLTAEENVRKCKERYSLRTY